jgi:hypothetical protein
MGRPALTSDTLGMYLVVRCDARLYFLSCERRSPYAAMSHWPEVPPPPNLRPPLFS